MDFLSVGSRLQAFVRHRPFPARSFETCVGFAFFLASCLGGWTQAFAVTFGAEDWLSVSAGEMAVFLGRKAFVTLFSVGGIFFLGVPFTALVFRSFFQTAADWLLRRVVEVGCILSLAFLPLLWGALSPPPPDCHNVMADVLVADAASMWVLHAGFAFASTEVPPWSLAMGPFVGLSLFLRGNPPRSSSLFLACLIMYANAGALHRAYRLIEVETGYDVLTRSVPLSSGKGTRYMPPLQCARLTFLLPCHSFAPLLVRRHRDRPYAVLLNGNAAAAWAASCGVFRRPLLTSWPPFPLCRRASELAIHT